MTAAADPSPPSAADHPGGDGASPGATGPVYVASVSFTEAFRCFAAGDTVELRAGVNLVVGDQGTGKSSLLQALVENAGSSPRRSAPPAKVTVGPAAHRGVRVLSFDFERDNPRVASRLFDDARIHSQLASVYSSHGQSVLAVINEVAAAAGDVVVVLDEPDMALSLRSAHRLAASLAAASQRGAQIVAAVHNPVVIASAAEVYSAEHRRWMPSAEFLASHTPDVSERT